MEQDYKNHRHYVPGFHLLTGGLIITCIVAAAVYVFHRYQYNGSIYLPILTLSITIVLGQLFWYSRLFALRAQDRAIRAEENLRHFVLTGQLLNKKLRMSQIIALRFADDEEFVSLVKKAADENMASGHIKRAIKSWKADHNRV